MAVECLAPSRGVTCVELCAAPGMKTSLLSQYIDPEATGEGCILASRASNDFDVSFSHIYSFDKNAKRLQTMRTLIWKHGVKNCTVTQADVLKVDLYNIPEV